METKYSFVTLAYKSLDNIKQRIDDVYNGDFPPSEFIVVINYYSNISWDILNYIKNEPRVTRYVFNSQNIGFAKGINLGISISKYPFIIMSNDDCKSNQTTYISLIKELQKENVGLSCVNYGTRLIDTIDIPLGFLLGIKKSVIKKIGGYVYDEDASPLGCEVELTYRMKYNGYDLQKCEQNYFEHVFDISSNPKTIINYLGEDMSPQGFNAFQFETIKIMNEKINNYKTKIK
jgi:GT2 family glycosyltransferase